jgi:hypothetical protein
MATKVFTDAEMTTLLVQTTAGGGWPAEVLTWQAAASMNGATGLITYAAPASPRKILLQSGALLVDDASLPPVLTVTNINFQFSWTIVTVGPSGPTEIGNAETFTAVPLAVLAPTTKTPTR